MGADSICIKDMSGLLKPYDAYQLVKTLKSSVSLPIQLHTHYTAGLASMTILKAVEAGVDIVDTAISPFATQPLMALFVVAASKSSVHRTVVASAAVGTVEREIQRQRHRPCDDEAPDHPAHRHGDDDGIAQSRTLSGGNEIPVFESQENGAAERRQRPERSFRRQDAGENPERRQRTVTALNRRPLQKRQRQHRQQQREHLRRKNAPGKPHRLRTDEKKRAQNRNGKLCASPTLHLESILVFIGGIVGESGKKPERQRRQKP